MRQVPIPASTQRRNRILLVEDDDASRRFVQIVLERAGLDVDFAGDGSEAIEALLRAEYALVLMDCKMPVMDGLEATKRIRGSDFLGNNQGIPIIAITAHAFQSNHKKCIAAGMDDWVTKPISGPELMQVVQKWLPSV